MAMFLIIMGVLLGAVAINDKVGDFGTLFKNDLVGSGQSYGFIVWAGAIIAVATVFRVVDLPDAGRFLVALIVIAYLLGHANIPTQVLQQLQSVGAPAAKSQ